MQNHSEYTPTDFFADSEAADALMDATCDLLKKLHREGLDDCFEFDKGVTALRHWYQRKKDSVEKLERIIRQLNNTADDPDGPGGE
ncbi:MAG: hypothetical protein KJ077_51315 [Anaerolineae bacterium]|nr:hypothetical protein [Anaerolineae bacterium]